VSLKKKAPDFILFITVMMLLSIGIVMVFSSSSYYAMFPPFNNPFHFLIRQLINALVGVPVMLFMMKYDYWKLKRWSVPLLLVAFLLLALVLTPLGSSRLGAQRWINLGFTSFQPSELAKLCIIVFVATSLSLKKNKVLIFREGVLPYLMLMAVSAGLILAEPDLGTAITLVGTIFIMLFCAGVKISTLSTVAILGVGSVMGAIFAEDYRRDRFFAFLNPEGDPTGAGWHILNSLMSIGSGGLLGTEGTQNSCIFLKGRPTSYSPLLARNWDLLVDAWSYFCLFFLYGEVSRLPLLHPTPLPAFWPPELFAV